MNIFSNQIGIFELKRQKMKLSKVRQARPRCEKRLTRYKEPFLMFFKYQHAVASWHAAYFSGLSATH